MTLINLALQSRLRRPPLSLRHGVLERRRYALRVGRRRDVYRRRQWRRSRPRASATAPRRRATRSTSATTPTRSSTSTSATPRWTWSSSHSPTTRDRRRPSSTTRTRICLPAMYSYRWAVYDDTNARWVKIANVRTATTPVGQPAAALVPAADGDAAPPDSRGISSSPAWIR